MERERTGVEEDGKQKGSDLEKKEAGKDSKKEAEEKDGSGADEAGKSQ